MAIVMPSCRELCGTVLRGDEEEVVEDPAQGEKVSNMILNTAD